MFSDGGGFFCIPFMMHMTPNEYYPEINFIAGQFINIRDFLQRTFTNKMEIFVLTISWLAIIFVIIIEWSLIRLHLQIYCCF